MSDRRDFLDGRVTVYPGDCCEVLATLPEASVDSVVCDPPYGLQFMGREWDKLWRNATNADQAYVEKTDGQLTSRARKLPDYSAAKPIQMQAFHEQWGREVFRVLKPGGHLVAFSGTRTYHRMVCAIEDAGFEIRDQIGWAYGSGFPKSHDVSKAIDKAAGAERQILTVPRRWAGRDPNGTALGLMNDDAWEAKPDALLSVTAPATEAAKQWAGWGTALKPAWEPIVLARKPLAGTVAENVTRYGTGALNIDGCRVPADGGSPSMLRRDVARKTGNAPGRPGEYGHTIKSRITRERYMEERAGEASGRWPANLVHDGSEEVLAAFPETQSGTGNKNVANRGNGVTIGNGLGAGNGDGVGGDSGSAARFFYCAKASADDRLGSKHPTVKPLDLMQWLVRMVTPPNGVVLDPFAGTGTTGEAAWREGMQAILIEREPEYVADIELRMSVADNPNKRAVVVEAGRIKD